jgi:hypothetical protein
MTNDKSCLVNHKKQTGLEIKCAGDQIIWSEGIGDAKVKFKNVNTPVDIKDVIYVPKLSANLLSVSTPVKRGLVVLFTDTGGTIYKKDELKITGVLRFTATQENGMYKLHHDDEKATAFRVISKSEQELWHCRLGHLSLGNMKLLRDGMVTGIRFKEQGALHCKSCFIRGQIKQPFNKKGGTRAKEILELVHSGVCGTMSEKAMSGYRYFIAFIDDKTFVYFLKVKDEVLSKFKEFTALVERQTGRKLKTLRSDNGTEYVCAGMKNFMREKGIKYQLTVQYTPEQNGIAECCNHTLCTKTRSMLADAKLDKKFWAEAVNAAMQLKNVSPTKAVKNMTSEEAWNGNKVDISYLRVFGCQAFMHIPDQQRKK